MFQVSTLVLLAMVGLLVAWLGNQLPSIGEFPGRNWLIVRSLFWLTLILVALQGFEQDLPQSADTVLRYVVVGSVVALLYEGWLLWRGARQSAARQQANRQTGQRLINSRSKVSICRKLT